MPDLMTLLANFSSQIAPLIMLLQGVASLIGLWLVVGALTEIWGVTHDNALKYVPSNKRFSVGSALVQLLIGALLSAMGTLQLVGVMSRTLTEDYANSRFLSYAPTGGTFDEQRLAAMAALLGIMQIVGFVAMVKGWLTINRYANGQGQAGMGQAFGWLIGGVIAWNFKWFTDVLNCTLGFNIIGMFVPFGVASSCP
jgi:intracellular multiplication protein IcmC